MLMDLKKLRELKFTKKIVEIYREHKQNIVWGDQDLLNIYFHKYPGRYSSVNSDFSMQFMAFNVVQSKEWTIPPLDKGLN